MNIENNETSKPEKETSNAMEMDARLEEFNALADEVLGPVEDNDAQEGNSPSPGLRRSRLKGIHRLVSNGLDWLCRGMGRAPRDSDAKDELASDVVEVVQEYVPAFEGTPLQNLAISGGLVLLDIVFDEKIPSKKEVKPDATDK